MNETEFDNGMKIFLRAYADDPALPQFNAFTKAQIRAYRARVIEQCEKQRDENPVAVTVMREIAATPLIELNEVMLNMKKLYDRFEEGYQKAVNP